MEEYCVDGIALPVPELEFKSYGKIESIKKMYMSITQKLHGTNAQILIDESGIVLAGSRSRYLTPDDDNYGFARWVDENKEELILKLGVGRHYGEWCGKGINSGEGLEERRLYLFNWHKFQNMPLPDRVRTVPVLYTGDFSFEKIDEVMESLKEKGSRIVRGYMKPEGIVINVDGTLYKKVFEVEEVKWKGEKKDKKQHEPLPDISYLLQPLRLEKLFSRDERYKRNYPESLTDIVKAYVKDLEDEGQFQVKDEDELKLHKKALGKQIFYFIRSMT